jgi:peptidoglycan-associated lipoprotein
MRKVMSVLLIGLLSACASETTKPTDAVVDRPATQGATSAVPGAPGTPTDPNLSPILTDPKNILSKRSVYYDYDSYVVKSEYRPLVQAHAQYLRDNVGARVLLQGNTDERGSREYNLALGQRRADSVKNAMTMSGARENQIEAVSLGEEKPRATGHDDASWSENRRTDIRYKGE